jgi:Spy/CpxP family protein refolding chaperone
MSPKKKMAIWITALAIGSLATVAAASAGARGGHCKHGGRFGHGGGGARLEHRIERLDLSADVRTKAFAIIDASRGEERALREKTRAAHEELRAMLESGAPNTKTLDAQVDELGALKIRKHKQYLHTLLQIGALLPEDQRAQWFAPPHRGKRGRESHEPTR